MSLKKKNARRLSGIFDVEIAKAKMMAKSDFKFPSNLRELKQKLYLADVTYNQATCVNELKEAYKLYTEVYSIANKKACINVAGLCELFSIDYDTRMTWKLKEYELGDQEAGKLAASYFYKGLCDQKKYRLYFEDYAKTMEPIALSAIAVAYHKGYGCEANIDIAHDYESKLIEALIGKKYDITDSSKMLSYVYENFLYVHDINEAADIVVDYLSEIGLATKKMMIAKCQGTSDFIEKVYETSLTTDTACYFIFGDEYFDLEVLVENDSELWFEKDDEVTFVLIGKNVNQFLPQLKIIGRYNFNPFQETNAVDSKQFEIENWNKKVDECWDLYDHGKYDEAYKMVLPIAKKGISKAVTMMGTLNTNGKGVPQNLEKAKEWYELGMKQGNWACFNNMGNIYFNYSENKEQGKIEAYRCYKEVIGKVNKVIAKRGLEILLSGLVPYNEKEKSEWINRLTELGEFEYLKNVLDK